MDYSAQPNGPGDTPIPMEVENLCAICHQFYTGPFSFCGYCGAIEATHHSDCCLEKPAHLRRRRTQPQPPGGRFPDFQPWVPPVPGPSTGQYVPPRGRLLIRPFSDDENLSARTPVPVKSRGKASSSAEMASAEPIVNWPKHGLSVPLAVWEQKLW